MRLSRRPVLRPFLAGAGIAVLSLCAIPSAAFAASAHKMSDHKATPIGHAETLLFFEKRAHRSLVNAAGRALKPSAALTAGDSLRVTGRDYEGSHAHHAKRQSASDTLTCTYASPTSATCTYVITISGSRITARHVAAGLSPGITTLAITNGSGRYQGARGLITKTQVAGTENADLSIVVLPSTSRAS
jgi:hypothetical protein